MREAVSRGTARRLADPGGVETAAKTGTAQLPGGHIDSWITVIVAHRYVVTVVVHDPPTDSAAVMAASAILPALPATPAVPSCPAPPRPAS